MSYIVFGVSLRPSRRKFNFPNAWITLSAIHPRVAQKKRLDATAFSITPYAGCNCGFAAQSIGCTVIGLDGSPPKDRLEITPGTVTVDDPCDGICPNSARHGNLATALRPKAASHVLRLRKTVQHIRASESTVNNWAWPVLYIGFRHAACSGRHIHISCAS